MAAEFVMLMFAIGKVEVKYLLFVARNLVASVPERMVVVGHVNHEYLNGLR